MKVESINDKCISGTASKLFEAVTIPCLKNSSFKNTDKQTQNSRPAQNRLKDQQALCLSVFLKKVSFTLIFLIQIIHCNFVMPKTDET